jgi:hypothetical protein
MCLLQVHGWAQNGTPRKRQIVGLRLIEGAKVAPLASKPGTAF